jgi:hypothetical protein
VIEAVCPTIEASRLLNSVRAVTKEQADRKSRTLKSAFERLRLDWVKIRTDRAIKDQARAPHHNIFRSLRLERKEVGFHSAFLCDLLNPDGSHGQGAIFLREFLALLAKKKPEATIWIDGMPDPSEWIVLPERQKVDISIRSLKASLLVFIENKIDAEEQESQLGRYRQLLEQQRHTYRKGVLVFLAPKAYGPAKTGTPDIHLTYEGHIARWLTDIEHKICPIKLRGNLRQYIEIVANMNGDVAMAVRKNQELIDLLKKPDNILCTLEISEEVENVKNDLRLSFWEQIDSDLRRRLNETGFAAAWSVCGLDDLRKDPRKSATKGIYLISNDVPRAGTQLQLGVWQESGPGRILYGIYFPTEQTVPHLLRQVNELLKGLKLSQEWTFPEAQKPGKWLCWQYADIDTSSRDFFIATASSNVTLTQPVTDTLFDLLLKHRELIQSASRALSGSETTG